MQLFVRFTIIISLRNAHKCSCTASRMAVLQVFRGREVLENILSLSKDFVRL